METIASKSFQDIIIGGKAFKPLSRGKRSLKEIAEYPIITLDRNTASYEFMRSLFLTEGISLEPSVEVSTTDQILPLVSHGIGLGFVPEQFARNAIAAKEVVMITPSSPIPPREICLMQNKNIFNYRKSYSCAVYTSLIIFTCFVYLLKIIGE